MAKKKVSRAQMIRVYLRAHPNASTAKIKEEVGKFPYGEPTSSEISKARKAIGGKKIKKALKTGAVDPVMPSEIDIAIDLVNASGGFKKAQKVLDFTKRIKDSLSHRLN